jgi:hypothetical protein
MLIKVNSGYHDGETIFKRKRAKDRKYVYEGGDLHLERIFARGGMIISVYHNYVTNQEEEKYMSIKTALEKYQQMAEMRENSPEWVDEHFLPAILKAIRAAQRQENEGQGIAVDMGDPSLEDIEAECGELSALIAEARKNDPELDKEMTIIEMEAAKEKRK